VDLTFFSFITAEFRVVDSKYVLEQTVHVMTWIRQISILSTVSTAGGNTEMKISTKMLTNIRNNMILAQTNGGWSVCLELSASRHSPHYRHLYL